jgi:hypothetical protein
MGKVVSLYEASAKRGIYPPYEAARVIKEKGVVSITLRGPYPVKTQSPDESLTMVDFPWRVLVNGDNSKLLFYINSLFNNRYRLEFHTAIVAGLIVSRDFGGRWDLLKDDSALVCSNAQLSGNLGKIGKSSEVVYRWGDALVGIKEEIWLSNPYADVMPLTVSEIEGEYREKLMRHSTIGENSLIIPYGLPGYLKPSLRP